MYVILGKYADDDLMCALPIYGSCFGYYPAIFVYDMNSLTLIKKLDLEKYIIKESGNFRIYSVVPYFVFCNSSGSEIFVISKVSRPNTNIWGVETIHLP